MGQFWKFKKKHVDRRIQSVQVIFCGGEREVGAKMNNSLTRAPYRGYPIKAVDLFCGAGGLTKGLELAGIDVKLGIDIDPACEFPYSANNKARFLLKSVDEVQANELKRAFKEPGLKLLAGCAPCQTFSSYNQKADSSDKRWWLLRQFARLIEETTPELVTMENVPGLVDQDVFQEFVDSLENLGYETDYRVVDCAEYGLPQKRNRLVLLASRMGEIEILSPEVLNPPKKTVREAIGNLPALKAGEIYPDDPLHQSSSLSPLNFKRILASRPGGTWRDWPRELVTNCHKKTSGKTYPSVYGRMRWDQPSPTVTTQFYGFGNGRFGHPEQNRALSLREGAILQSFPEKYEFVAPGKPICKKTVGRLIGNAVPVKLGEVIGISLVAHVR
jgi:DNA (cytosine-5)-methyltransferase 1